MKPCSHGQEKYFPGVPDLSWYLCPESHQLTSQLAFSFFLGCSAQKPVPLDIAVHALRPQTDVMLMLVPEFLCHEQLFLYEATVLLSDPLQHCFLHHS